MKLTSFTIFVQDVKKAATFYEDLFGRPPKERGNNSCTFLFDSVKYFIHKKSTWEEGVPPNEDHVEFEVDNLDEEIERLKTAGLVLKVEAKKYYWGTSAYLRDLDGRLIELVQK